MVTFNLPCKKYTKHYLENCFGAPAYLRNDSVIGKYFFQLVEEGSQKRESERFYDYPESCTIIIRQDLFMRKGYMLSKTGIREFNTFVEDHFKTQVFIMLDTMVHFQNCEINRAIDCVYDKFDMDETIMPQETIRRNYHRYRVALEKKQEAILINKSLSHLKTA